MWVVSGKGSVMANEVTSHSHMSVCWINRILMRTSAEYSSTVCWQMGTICFFPQLPSIQFSYRCQKQSSLYKHSVTCDLFKTELLHSHLYLPYSGYETGGLVWLTSELAVLSGSGCACMRGAKYLTPFSWAIQINLWKTDGQEKNVTHCLPWFLQWFCFHSETILSMAADCSLPLTWSNHALCE